MADIIDIDPLSPFMALFTGHNGSGKSVAIGSWKKKGSIYFFDYDGRMAAVSNWYKQRGLQRGQLQYDTYGPSNLFDGLYKLRDWSNSYCPHAAIVIDSFTAVTVSAVTFSLNHRMGEAEKRSGGNKNSPSMSKGNLIVPDWEEFKGETVYVTQMLDYCKSIAAKGTAVFWTAHPVTTTRIEKGAGGQDKYGKQTRYAAYGFKTDSLIPIYFNEIYHFTTEWDYNTSSVKRWCFTQPNGEINAKTALNLPVQFEWTNADFYDTFSELVRQGEGAIEAARLDEGIESSSEKGEESNDVAQETAKASDWF